jgi:hypothetical protein
LVWPAWLAALAAGLVLGSCLGELPRGRSCGDGWWDQEFEDCDPSSADQRWVDACRDQGWDVDASCTDFCELRASEADCNRCGDGIAAGSEQCDGDDVRGATCPGGAGTVRCTDVCTLDYEQCPAVCGDGIVNGNEECDAGNVECTGDETCGPGRVCSALLGKCVSVSGGFDPNLVCSDYPTTAIGFDKPYASGNVDRCTNLCEFGRNHCSFCGDGQLDPNPYTDRIFPEGTATFPGERCDGNQAVASDIDSYCKPLCIDEFVAANVVLACDFKCNNSCSGFAPPEDVTPGELGCCLAKNSPCPFQGTANVPDLPCCAWAGKPVEQHNCVPSGNIPVSYVCP